MANGVERLKWKTKRDPSDVVEGYNWPNHSSHLRLNRLERTFWDILVFLNCGQWEQIHSKLEKLYLAHMVHNLSI